VHAVPCSPATLSQKVAGYTRCAWSLSPCRLVLQELQGKPLTSIIAKQADMVDR
jgi:hypothetical protein